MSRRNEESLYEGVTTAQIPRITLHPAAAGGWLPSGDSLDAGTMHHLASNLSLLCRESARHLVADVGPGQMPRAGSTYTGTGWDGGYTDGTAQAPTDQDDAQTRIAWDRRTARSYHLPNLIADRELQEGGYGLRVIEVEVDCVVDTAESLRLFAALTPSYATPDQGCLAVATWSNWSATGEQFRGATSGTISGLPTGRQTVRLWLITRVPAAAPWAQWRCRTSGSVGATHTLVHEGHLWVGWHSTDVDNQILSINAWEVPEPFLPLVDTSVSSDLRFWFRADLNVVSNKTTYAIDSALIDQSAQYGNMTASGLTVDIAGFNARPFVEFTGTGNATDTNPFGGAIPTDFTIFAVLTPRETPSGTYVPVWEYNDGYPSTGGFGIRSQGNQYGGWAEDAAGGFIGSTLTNDRAHIVCFRGNTTDLYWYVNGLQVATGTRPAAGAAPSNGLVSGFTVGVLAAGGVGDFDLAEVLYYEVGLSTAERAFVLEYLNRRYGVF